MTLGAWSRPVCINAGRHGATRCLVGDTARAVDVLTFHWPRRSGSKYVAACRACRDVLNRDALPETARELFKEAALEAGILEE